MAPFRPMGMMTAVTWLKTHHGKVILLKLRWAPDRVFALDRCLAVAALKVESVSLCLDYRPPEAPQDPCEERGPVWSELHP